MHAPRWFFLVIAALIVAQSVSAETRKSPVTVPDGTKVQAVKLEGNDAEVTLSQEEQVAFLFLYGIWNLESRCLDKDNGIGRLATLGELVKGVKTPGGETFGLSINPVKDTNYSYDLMLVGTDVVIRANPRARGLGGFALVGSPNRIMGNFYYNSKGGDFTKAIKLSEMGYGGDGFVR